MTDHPSCGTPCGQPCADVCPADDPAGCGGPAHALARFEREAVTGICDTGRYRLRYYSWGKGPPVVFIHGVADTSRSFLMLIARLSARFRCIAYDLPSGHGDGAVLGRYQHEHLAHDTLALIDHLGIDRAYLLGASFGSTIALRLLRHWPGRFPRAILQGGLAHRPLRRAERWLTWLFRFLPGPTSALPKREKLLARTHQRPFARQPAEVWRAYVDWTGQARIAALGYQGQWLHGVDLRAELPHICQPVLLIHGDRDPVVPLYHAEVLRAGLPNSGLAILEGCGHVPCYTHPDAFAELISQFLTPPTVAACSPLLTSRSPRGTS